MIFVGCLSNRSKSNRFCRRFTITRIVHNSFRSAAGFTLIELLLAIGIVGILAAIAIPQFRSYKGRAFDARAQSMLRTVATAEEAYFVDFTAYKNCDQSTCPTALPNLDPIEIGIILAMTATPTGFTGLASHVSGTGEVYTWP